MGIIHQEVLDQHLFEHENEEELLNSFLNGFDITWARKRKAFNTELSVYFIKANENYAEAYGFSQEILLIYASYSEMQPRTIQAAESFLTESPAKGRVENLTYILISEDDKAKDWINQYLTVNPESRIIIPFSASELRAKKGDNYYVRTILNENLYGRDLFNYRLPLETDHYFFGRKDIVAKIYDSIRKPENKGLFGLRKTGKTSIIYKILRQASKDNSEEFIFYLYDCKDPSIRTLRWFELLKRLCIDVSNEFNIQLKEIPDSPQISRIFSDLIQEIAEIHNKKIVFIFDEFEYISPIALLDRHWKIDYIHFWQTFWATQSKYRIFCAIIVGVNPLPLEVSNIEQIQNPLLQIVDIDYLKGLSLEDMKIMTKKLGKRMGLKFDHTAIDYLYSRYGGHPLLTRIACSLINNSVINSEKSKPVVISSDQLKSEEEVLNATLSTYSSSIVYELENFYGEEYHLLELLASGQVKQFIEMVKFGEQINHLKEFGLVSYDTNNLPSISIPAVGRYIGYQYMKKEGRKTIYKVLEGEDRAKWLYNTKKMILSDMKELENRISKKKCFSLYGPNSFPFGHEFSDIEIALDKPSYKDFIDTTYRCFVESIDNYGNSINKNKYYWKQIKETYPTLWDAFQRIRIYRVASFHGKLNDIAQEQFTKYINIDLEGQNPNEVPDIQYVIQQRTLDNLLVAIQVETYKLS